MYLVERTKGRGNEGQHHFEIAKGKSREERSVWVR